MHFRGVKWGNHISQDDDRNECQQINGGSHRKFVLEDLAQGQDKIIVTPIAAKVLNNSTCTIELHEATFYRDGKTKT